VTIEIDAYGEGPLLQQLQMEAERLGVSSLLTFRGAASHGALLERLASKSYDFAVLPSVTAADGDKEGIPVFLMEAMAAGLPVISTKNGGIEELLRDGAGILIEERDVDGLADAMLTLAENGELRSRLAVAGRERVAASFSISQTADRLRSRIRNLSVSSSSRAADCTARSNSQE
jgi:glycosyltransferase involved in cell wall biosynthesis